ncbi:MAG: hypothetical protein K0S33_962 [Bacteroidetes bacterium]|nr:hypothetical protein [Bacteroidota bacterium]
MDHSNAHLIEFTGRTIQLNHISVERILLQNGECLCQKVNARNEQRNEYFKKLAEQIRNYKEVLLFGPNTAKAELYMLLKEDGRFTEIKIDLRPTDRMTENQEHIFVKSYFMKARKQSLTPEYQ